jgi:hypothetical protein
VKTACGSSSVKTIEVVFTLGSIQRRRTVMKPETLRTALSELDAQSGTRIGLRLIGRQKYIGKIIFDEAADLVTVVRDEPLPVILVEGAAVIALDKQLAD